MNRIFPKSLKKHWGNPSGLIQVFVGPRQVGKTTAALSLMKEPVTVYASADLPAPPTTEFISEHWQKTREISSPDRTLILDEIQKIPRWSEVVKQLWDEDKRNQLNMRVCLLGSSAILIEKGLSESLMGRFELNMFPHWTFVECETCFGASVEEYAKVGGYPKAYDLKSDPERLENYIQNSIIEPALGRDILALHSVDKPALLRQLFWYVSQLPARIVSYEKILGHLQDRGNSTTLTHYASLLSVVFMLAPISKFSLASHHTKKSIPKWIIPNPVLVESSVRRLGLKDGFVFENLVGSHLLNICYGQKDFELKYWREDDREIDFVLTEKNKPFLALEVKSGRPKKIPSVDFLRKIGIDCSVSVVHRDNLGAFLRTASVHDVLILFGARV